MLRLIVKAWSKGSKKFYIKNTSNAPNTSDGSSEHITNLVNVGNEGDIAFMAEVDHGEVTHPPGSER